MTHQLADDLLILTTETEGSPIEIYNEMVRTKKIKPSIEEAKEILKFINELQGIAKQIRLKAVALIKERMID